MAESAVGPGPCGELPPELAEVLRPELPQLADEIVEEIRRHVPEFDRAPLSGFGDEIRMNIEKGLTQFIDRLADPSGPGPHDTEIPRALGMGEFREGRSMDSLQTAYRIGARMAWRQFAFSARQAGFGTETMCALAEAVFAYIEEAAASSARAYSELATHAIGRLQRRRRELLELLTCMPQHSSRDAIHRIAAEAQWRLPADAACVAVEGSWQDAHLVSPAVSSDVLLDLERPDPFLLVPDADGPGRQSMLDRALDGVAFAVGPTLGLGQAPLSLRLARQTLALVQRGVIPAVPAPRSIDHLPTLLLFADEELVGVMVQRAYSDATDLKPGHRGQLLETLLAFLSTGGSYPEIGAHLNVHAQTVRYRMKKLEELFGDRIRDPRWRFEMQIVLRCQTLLDGQRTDI